MKSKMAILEGLNHTKGLNYTKKYEISTLRSYSFLILLNSK